MNILGIGGYSHDSAAALVCDGELVAGVAEERITRVKHQGGVPREAIAWCLERAGITRDDLDHVGCYMRPGYRVARRLAYRATRFARHPLYSAAYMGYELVHNAAFMRDMRSVCGARTRLHYLDHHAAHAASAFLVSPFEEAALMSIDYVGEIASTWLGVGRGTDITMLREVRYPNSLGVFYSAMTDYLGFLRASDEYKVMGLASYGEPEYLEDFRRILRPGEGAYDIDLSWAAWDHSPGSRVGYVSRKFIERFGAPRKKGEPIEERHRNIAASAQAALEETVLHMAQWLQRETGLENLGLAGGVALNCSMNGRLLRESPFKNIWVQPASGDDGIAIGGAFQLHHRFSDGPRGSVMRDARIGPEFTDEEIRAALDAEGAKYETVADPGERCAELLAAGKIVGWYQGAMEFGPRALGSRSILADPTLPGMKDRINARVKHREEFRPFAPSVLEERADEYFENCTDSPFMLFVYPVRPEKREVLPAITHVDGTARVQTVSRETHRMYYDMIRAFEARRGVPVVLNTSFNVMGEPIVNTPADAYRCYLGTGVDALVMGDCVLVKPDYEPAAGA